MMANSALKNNDFFNGRATATPPVPTPQQYGQQPQFGQQAPYGQQPAYGQAPQYGQQQYGYQQAPSPEQLYQQFQAPAATRDQMDRMSYEDVIAKTAGVFAVLLASAALAWFVPLLAIVGALGALVTGIVLAFKREPSPALTFTFGVFEGFLVGGFSSLLEAQYAGIVFQAGLATAVVIGVVLLLFLNSKVRTSPKFTQFFMIAGLAYFIFSLLNFGLMMFGAGQQFGTWGLRSIEVFGIPLGVIIGIFAVLMGAYMLVTDFEYVQRGVRGGAPRAYGWIAAYSLVSTVVYIYIELLRIIAILRGND
ncbi:Bax inhibitor-1/YccA family protein [Pseudoclavibacter alba]|uniref:Bax inhibitor-1/YccA family protein n=1 Tax=Pseudoclavibacter albus TaxID=272241 RepID=A0ABT2HY32_9MICO|nr:Bax inhibitor-1/YccA family protein [Pseudoclavibacter alba]MCT2043237.1 Bax inhibitor-1/YccA family protein [Pseudoclavibacter alba]